MMLIIITIIIIYDPYTRNCGVSVYFAASVRPSSVGWEKAQAERGTT
jgi:hypothetical protein